MRGRQPVLVRLFGLAAKLLPRALRENAGEMTHAVRKALREVE